MILLKRIVSADLPLTPYWKIFRLHNPSSLKWTVQDAQLLNLPEDKDGKFVLRPMEQMLDLRLLEFGLSLKVFKLFIKHLTLSFLFETLEELLKGHICRVFIKETETRNFFFFTPKF